MRKIKNSGEGKGSVYWVHPHGEELCVFNMHPDACE